MTKGYNEREERKERIIGTKKERRKTMPKEKPNKRMQVALSRRKERREIE
jgi:hypothetical protein